MSTCPACKGRGEYVTAVPDNTPGPRWQPQEPDIETCGLCRGTGELQ